MEAKNRLSEKMVEFCRLYASGKMPSEAYSVAFKNDKIATCGVNSNKLLKRSDIQEQIAKFQALNKSLVDAANEIAIKDIAEGSIADAKERMQILTQIIRGEIPLNKPMVVDKQIVEISTVPDWSDRRAAIAELNKMDGSYAATKTDITVKQEQPLFPDTK